MTAVTDSLCVCRRGGVAWPTMVITVRHLTRYVSQYESPGGATDTNVHILS